MAKVINKGNVTVEFTQEEFEVLVEWLGKTSHNRDKELFGEDGARLLGHIYATLCKE